MHRYRVKGRGITVTQGDSSDTEPGIDLLTFCWFCESPEFFWSSFVHISQQLGGISLKSIFEHFAGSLDLKASFFGAAIE